MSDDLASYFLTNPARVLLCLIEDSHATTRSIARRLRISERAVQRIIRDLEARGCMTHRRSGRNNAYVISPNHALPLMWWASETASLED